MPRVILVLYSTVPCITLFVVVFIEGIRCGETLCAVDVLSTNFCSTDETVVVSVWSRKKAITCVWCGSDRPGTSERPWPAELPEATHKRAHRALWSDKQHVAPDTSGKPRPLLLEQTISHSCSPTPSRQTATQQCAELPSTARPRCDLVGPRLSFRRAPRPFSGQQPRICTVINRYFSPTNFAPLFA